MAKVAIVVLAGTETHEGLGRVVNALEAAKELKEGPDEVRIIFDGAGTAWIPELSRKEHKAHRLYESVADRIVGVCAYCAGVFGVKDAVVAQGAPLASEYEGHPSVRRLVHDGYQVITF
jgi:hypothetical protein